MKKDPHKSGTPPSKPAFQAGRTVLVGVFFCRPIQVKNYNHWLGWVATPPHHSIRSQATPAEPVAPPEAVANGADLSDLPHVAEGVLGRMDTTQLEVGSVYIYMYIYKHLFFEEERQTHPTSWLYIYICMDVCCHFLVYICSKAVQGKGGKNLAWTIQRRSRCHFPARWDGQVHWPPWGWRGWVAAFG